MLPQRRGTFLIMSADNSSFDRYGEAGCSTSCVLVYTDSIHFEVFSALNQRSGTGSLLWRLGIVVTGVGALLSWRPSEGERDESTVYQ